MTRTGTRLRRRQAGRQYEGLTRIACAAIFIACALPAVRVVRDHAAKPGQVLSFGDYARIAGLALLYGLGGVVFVVVAFAVLMVLALAVLEAVQRLRRREP